MQRVRCRGRDVGIAPRRRQPLLGERRIIIAVDEVIDDAGMVGMPGEERLEDRRRPHWPGKAHVVRRLGRRQIERREDLRLIPGELRRQRLEGIGQRAQPRRVQPFGEALVIGGNRLDIAPLALRSGADGAALRDRLLCRPPSWARRPRRTGCRSRPWRCPRSRWRSRGRAAEHRETPYRPRPTKRSAAGPRRVAVGAGPPRRRNWRRIRCRASRQARQWRWRRPRRNEPAPARSE